MGSPCPPRRSGSHARAPRAVFTSAAIPRSRSRSCPPIPSSWSTAINRLAGGQKLVRRRVDVLELRVAVRVCGAFLPFAYRLQPVAQAVQQPTHRGRTHPPPLLGQRRRQLRATLARPAQRRGRVPTRERVHAIRAQPGCRVDPAECGAVRRPGDGRDPARRLTVGNLPAPVANRLPGQTGSRGHQRVAAIANGQRLGCRPPASAALSNTGATAAYLATIVAPARCRAARGQDGLKLIR